MSSIDQTSLDLINNQRLLMKNALEDKWEKVLKMEYLYGKYNFIVFDLPKFELDDQEKFLNVWHNQNVDCGRIKKDIASPYTVDPTPRFRCVDILDVTPDQEKIWTSNFYDMTAVIPRFYQQMYDLLPFKKINYVRLWQSKQNIRWHRDDSWWYVNFPSEIRIMMYNENSTGTLGIIPETKPANIKFVNLPEESNSFAFNNVRCLHGSYKHNNVEKILACFSGILDLDKFDKLLENSASKYGHLSSITENDSYENLLLK